MTPRSTTADKIPNTKSPVAAIYLNCIKACTKMLIANNQTKSLMMANFMRD
jgi:hypothetical protein